MTSIKVTEAATVFRGEETIYHYDFPAAGILEGWAIPGIKQKLAELGGDLELPIEGEHPAVGVLTEALVSGEEPDHDCQEGFSGAEPVVNQQYGGDAAREELPAVDPTPTDPALPVVPSGFVRPTSSPGQESRFQLTWFHIVIAAVIVVVIAASWWAMQATTSQETAVSPSSDSASIPVTRQESSLGKNDQALPDAAPPESVLLETDLLRIHAPQGFRAEPENGGWVLNGEDSDLRIHLIVNRVFGVPPAEMFKEIRATVESDPTLSEFTEPGGSNSKASYLENPGDGSQVRWVIWFSGDNEISVGCQTRTVPTLVQRAACSMVADSTVLKANSG